MISQFFNSLSIKFRKENDLSDITWAMCQACDSFRNAFLCFFFKDFDTSADVIIEREKSEDDCRPDFVIDCNGETYIIENKIYDTNHHFGQYDKAFNVTPQRIGYIANYPITDKEIVSKGYPIRTWEQLYESFLNNLPEDEEDKIIWKGYLCYLKNVCNIIKIEIPMKLNGIHSLYSLIKVFEKLSNRIEEDFELFIYHSNSICGTTASRLGITGVNFEVKYKHITQEKQIWGWIGIYYDRQEPLIDIEFRNHDAWGAGYCEMVLPYKSEWKNQTTFSRPYIKEKEYICFELNKELHEKFNKSDDIKEQESILKAFMDEVLRYPFTLK